MSSKVMAGIVALLATGAVVMSQGGGKPMSPEGSTAAQVLGKWTKGERPAFTLGRETYQNGRWIEIT